ncbi:type III secretion system gatekeeper subunit SctW [Pantoea sp. B65]|uniref:type III secretion system gatekeeper subunit SctW n=1 Tax=Pantoea sp. B65 TaxID=2813359 RepID=UPI0039B3B0EB
MSDAISSLNLLPPAVTGTPAQDKGRTTGKKSELNDSLRKPLGNTTTATAGRSADDDGLLMTTEKFLNSVDELSAYVSLVRNRREVEKRSDFYAAAELYELLDEDAGAKLDCLWRIIRVSAVNQPALLLQELRTLFPDESDRVVALRQMLKQRNIAEIERELLEQALASLEQSADPKRLKSGINVALKARLFGKQLNLSPVIVRESYRNFIESDETEREIYLHWVLMFGGNRRHMMINFMESALLADMNASDPGCTDMEFGNLLGRLTQIKIIRSSDRLFIKCARDDKFIAQFPISEDQWLLFILPLLKDGGLLYQQLEQLAGGVLTHQPTSIRVRFLQKIYRFITGFPAQIYDDSEQQEILHQHFVALIGHGYNQELAQSRGY